MFRKLIAAAIAPAAVLGGLTFASGVAHAATVTAPTTVTATTHVTDRQDSGNGGLWAYDTFDRTLTVTADPANNQTDMLAYTATVTDKGGFAAIVGAKTPNQSTAGAVIAHGVHGDMEGSVSYTILAPNTDTLTGVVPATEADNFGTPANTTSNWPAQAFKTPVDAKVTEGSDWSWTYKTACESWTDAAGNGDGNFAADGNITGKTCPTPPPPAATPYVYGGHVVTVNNNRATVGFSESDKGWPDSTSKCVEVWISGYGFGAWDPANPTDPGTAHVGFTCDHSGTNMSEGFLSGLARNHNYALRIVPATGTYGHNTPIPGAHVGYVDVLTTNAS